MSSSMCQFVKCLEINNTSLHITAFQTWVLHPPKTYAICQGQLSFLLRRCSYHQDSSCVAGDPMAKVITHSSPLLNKRICDLEAPHLSTIRSHSYKVSHWPTMLSPKPSPLLACICVRNLCDIMHVSLAYTGKGGRATGSSLNSKWGEQSCKLPPCPLLLYTTSTLQGDEIALPQRGNGIVKVIVRSFSGPLDLLIFLHCSGSSSVAQGTY